MTSVKPASRIRVLDEKTINQVAAGEVIESTASVVKELIENSLDAKSSEIRIEILSGGRNLMRIEDNGEGMGTDDALLAFERHATSKIRSLQDLSLVRTMGFRGEALPSIASVSKCVLTTSQKGEATEVTIHGGRFLSQKPSSREKGTTVEVRSLFFNVPVRRQFQKSVAWDAQRIYQVVCEESLANPNTKFTLVSEGKKTLETFTSWEEPSEQKVRKRLEEALGSYEFKEGHYAYLRREQVEIFGLLGDPIQTRSNRKGQHLFLNKRAVWSPFISKCIKQGLGTRIPAHRHPIFALWITLPTEWVDVNVHPQKTEVRLRCEEQIEEALGEFVRKVLQPKSPKHMERVSSSVPRALKIEAASPPPPTSSKKESWSLPKLDLPIAPIQPNPVMEWKDIQVYTLIGSYALISSKYVSAKLDTESSLLLVHMSRAEQRICYEALCARKKERSWQKLLIPLSFDFTKKEALQVQEILPELEELGFPLRALDAESFIMDSVDSRYHYLDLARWMKDFLLEWIDHKEKGVQRAQDMKWMAQITEKASMRNKNYSTAWVRKMIEELLKTEEWMRSPLGKPIFKVLSEEVIQRKIFV